MALIEANAQIASTSSDPGSRFYCECGRRTCTEQVPLTHAQYLAIRERGAAVLAMGHRTNHSSRARELRREAQALVAQAKHQRRRAGENTALAQEIVLASLPVGEPVWVKGRPATFRELLPRRAVRVHFDGESGTRVVSVTHVSTRQPSA